MAVPVVTATTDKSTYNPGETVVVTFTVQDSPVSTPGETTTKVINWTGTDGEGNVVSGTITINLQQPPTSQPDTFTLTSVKWEGGTSFTINGLTAVGTA